MDIFLLFIGFLFTLLGIAGAFSPILPGPLTGWFGLLILFLIPVIPINYTFLGVTLAIAIAIWILDYSIPAMGTKKFGGTKAGVTGTTIGLIVGLILPIPFGFVIGAFLGAFIGELSHQWNLAKATRAAWGSFLGFLASTALKFIVSVIFMALYIYTAVGYWELLF